MNGEHLDRVVDCLRDGEPSRAVFEVREFLNEFPVSAELSLSARLSSSSDLQQRFNPLRLYCLGSYTLEPLIPFVKAWGLANGLCVDTLVCAYGQFRQEVLSAESRLYESSPDAVLISIQANDLVPGLEFRTIEEDETIALRTADSLVESIESLVARIRQHSRAKIVIQGFDISRAYPGGILAFQSQTGLPWVIRDANRRIASLTRKYRDVAYIDTEAMVAEVGPGWYSEANWYTSRNPLSGYGLRELGRHVVRAILALLGRNKKCVVLDLDNTLWGGIVGDDGPDGIKIGPDYPGNNYLAFQKWLQQLEDLGFVLAVNSKNEEPLVREVLQSHPHMVLREDDFAAIVANWGNKANNIRDIAERLNLGSDSFIFVDDSAFELEVVRQAQAEVACYRMDELPLQVIRRILGDGGFDKLSVTAEDRTRTKMYRAEGRRARLEVRAASLDEFLTSLEMRATIGYLDPSRAERIAQLTQKTNQFNLTTRRFTVGEVEDMGRSPLHRVLWMEVEDKFGSYGLVGVVILRVEGHDWWIHDLLLSCRVMGRTVEDALVRVLADMAHSSGAKSLIGEYIPTKRNAVVRDLYKRLGFERVSNDSDGGSDVWRLPLPNNTIGSAFVKVEVLPGEREENEKCP